MRSFLCAALLLLGPLTALADDCITDVRALNALYDVRETMLFRPSWEVGSRIDRHLDELRGPLPGGGHRWVLWARPAGEGPVEKREHLVSTAEAGGDREAFEASGDRPYAVRVVVPRKRSTFKANNPVYVDTLTVRYRVDGEEKVLEQRIGQWMAPDTSKTFDLKAIAERAEATVDVATRQGLAGQALVEIHFRQAVQQDDPDNPDYAAIQVLRSLGSSPDPGDVEREIARIESRLFPDSRRVSVYALIDSLRSAEKLMASEKADEQEKGKKLLKETIASVDAK